MHKFFNCCGTPSVLRLQLSAGAAPLGVDRRLSTQETPAQPFRKAHASSWVGIPLARPGLHWVRVHSSSATGMQCNHSGTHVQQLATHRDMRHNNRFTLIILFLWSRHARNHNSHKSEIPNSGCAVCVLQLCKWLLICSVFYFIVSFFSSFAFSVHEYLELEGPTLVNMRIKHLIKVDSVDKAAVLAKMCSEYPGYEGKGNFKQTYLVCLCMTKSQEQLMEEVRERKKRHKSTWTSTLTSQAANCHIIKNGKVKVLMGFCVSKLVKQKSN